VPLAVVLRKGRISFGGVIAFTFADLIIAPILNIYRKYYGGRMALFLLATFYEAMAGPDSQPRCSMVQPFALDGPGDHAGPRLS
jgi:hypothetical protein